MKQGSNCPAALLVLAAALATLVAGVGPGVVTTVRAVPAPDDAPCRGTVTDPANGMTVVSVQGARAGTKKPARLVGLRPNGTVAWVHDQGGGTIWSYDVDPLPNGNLFVVTTVRSNGDGDTVVYEYDPQTGKRVWQHRFEALDTHDADLIDGGRAIVVANMRNTGSEGDRIFVYNRTRNEVTWQWKFANHGFEPSGGGNYSEDWTHVNDVDAIGGDRFVVSARNFDQVLIINRTTKEIEYRLGRDDATEILDQQHNPDFLVGPNGRPTLLVADSENDRVVEYTLKDGEWVRTWTLTGNLSWPRDADRLPNGNTLVVDSWHHRVIEVTPRGKVVWEAYTPWLVYDAERLRTGGGSRGPTMAELGVNGTVTVHGSARLYENTSALKRCAAHLRTLPRRTTTPVAGTGRRPANGTASGSGTSAGSPTPGGSVVGVGEPLVLGVAGVLAAAFALLAARRRGS